MAKKRVRRKGVRKSAGRTVREARALTQAGRTIAGAQEAPRRNRMRMVVKNLILFAVLFVLSTVIASSSSDVVVQQSFWILAILTGFVAVALLIVLLVFLFMGRAKR
ncbi:MAG: hypothetical protein AABW63_00400 [Nanoarchaeota archaeon]